VVGKLDKRLLLVCAPTALAASKTTVCTEIKVVIRTKNFFLNGIYALDICVSTDNLYLKGTLTKYFMAQQLNFERPILKYISTKYLKNFLTCLRIVKESG
jgi:hypothetical protein